MTIATSDKYIWVPVDNGKTVAVKYAAPVTGDKFVYLPDSAGRSVAQKYTPPTQGGKYLNLPVNGGRYVALSLGAAASVWEQLDDGTWSGRGNHCMCTFSDGDVILFGGYADGGTYLYDGWLSTDRGENWSVVTTKDYWTSRQGAASVVLSDDSILMFGGLGLVYSNDTWHTTDKGSSWHSHSTSAGWSARVSFGGVRLSDYNLLVMGGFVGAAATYKNDVWHSTDLGSSWHNVTSSAEWPARQNIFPQVIDDRIIFAGGYGAAGGLDDAWISDDDGATWEQTSTAVGWSAPDTRPYYSCIAGGNMLVFGYGLKWSTVIGGWKKYNDILVTDDGETWANSPIDYGNSTDYRMAHSAAGWSDGDFIITGGTKNSVNYLAEVWRYA